MNKSPSWIFYTLFILYVLYNAAWMIGITFSWGKNDTIRELLYLLFTFIIDIPVIWYLTKNLYAGLTIFISIFICGVVLGWPWHLLNRATIPMWYAPKVFVVMAAVWANVSSRRQSLTDRPPLRSF